MMYMLYVCIHVCMYAYVHVCTKEPPSETKFFCPTKRTILSPRVFNLCLCPFDIIFRLVLRIDLAIVRHYLTHVSVTFSTDINSTDKSLKSLKSLNVCLLLVGPRIVDILVVAEICADVERATRGEPRAVGRPGWSCFREPHPVYPDGPGSKGRWRAMTEL